MNTHSMPEALVFDFDGVIADTEPLYWKAWRALLSRYNYAFEWADYCRIGCGIRDEKVVEYLEGMVADRDLASRLKGMLPEYRELVQRWKCDYQGISDVTVLLLKSLKGRRLGLVTSSDRPDVELQLDRAGLLGCFHACVFGDEIPSHKPEPAPYLLIRERLGVDGGVAFEDSEAGLLSATRAGFKTVRVSTPQELPDLVWRLLLA